MSRDASPSRCHEDTIYVRIEESFQLTYYAVKSTDLSDAELGMLANWRHSENVNWDFFSSDKSQTKPLKGRRKLLHALSIDPVLVPGMPNTPLEAEKHRKLFHKIESMDRVKPKQVDKSVNITITF